MNNEQIALLSIGILLILPRRRLAGVGAYPKNKLKDVRTVFAPTIEERNKKFKQIFKQLGIQHENWIVLNKKYYIDKVGNTYAKMIGEKGGQYMLIPFFANNGIGIEVFDKSSRLIERWGVLNGKFQEVSF